VPPDLSRHVFIERDSQQLWVLVHKADQLIKPPALAHVNVDGRARKEIQALLIPFGDNVFVP
jgi:hypothetical protein